MLSHTASPICTLKRSNDAINARQLATQTQFSYPWRQISRSWRSQNLSCCWSSSCCCCCRGSRSCGGCGCCQNLLALAIAICHSALGSERKSWAFTLKKREESIILAKLQRLSRLRLKLRVFNETHQLAFVDFHRHHIRADRIIVVSIQNHRLNAAFTCKVEKRKNL